MNEVEACMPFDLRRETCVNIVYLWSDLKQSTRLNKVYLLSILKPQMVKYYMHTEELHFGYAPIQQFSYFIR